MNSAIRIFGLALLVLVLGLYANELYLASAGFGKLTLIYILAKSAVDAGADPTWAFFGAFVIFKAMFLMYTLLSFKAMAFEPRINTTPNTIREPNIE